MRSRHILGALKRPPSQYPEQALMAAVLADAVTLLVSTPPRPKRQKDHNAACRDRREAMRWVREASRAHPFGFGTICDVLDLDVEALQAALEEDCDLGAILRARPRDGNDSSQNRR